MNGLVSVVIPAYNEEAVVQSVIEELKAVLETAGIETEILVIDDCSGDATGEVALRAGARVLRHRSNRGYGAALKTGILAARNNIIAITDADGTYPAKYLPQMLAELERADMVVGARTGQKVHIPWVRRLPKWLLNRLANYLAGAKIPDLNSGLRVFRRETLVQYFPILPDQFSWTTTSTLALHCDRYAVSYVTIDYRERTGKSKIVPWDAGSFLILILRTAMLFRPLRVFLPLIVICILYAIVKISIDLQRDPNISATAILAMLSALIILLFGMLGDAVTTRLGRLGQNSVSGAYAAEELKDDRHEDC